LWDSGGEADSHRQRGVAGVSDGFIQPLMKYIDPNLF